VQLNQDVHSGNVALDIDISDDRKILPEDDMIEMIKKQGIVTRTPCVCRSFRHIEDDSTCSNPGNCLYFNEVARAFIKDGVAEEITKEEAIENITDASKRGLVLMCDNSDEEIYVICECCECHCNVVRSVQRGESNMMATKYEPVRNEAKCSSCMICVDVCPIDAIEVQGEKPVTLTEKCFGCGVCSVQCPDEAITLKERENSDDYRSLFDSYLRHTPADIKS
jgi:Fe-S-cluster-containing hydrogenase component 2